MDFLGSITEVDLDRWMYLISRHSLLFPVPAQEGVDPFTKDRHTYRAHPGDAVVLVAGRQVGLMTWAQDGTNRIAVEGDAILVEAVALEVAAKLGGIFRRGQ